MWQTFETIVIDICSEVYTDYRGFLYQDFWFDYEQTNGIHVGEERVFTQTERQSGKRILAPLRSTNVPMFSSRRERQVLDANDWIPEKPGSRTGEVKPRKEASCPWHILDLGLGLGNHFNPTEKANWLVHQVLIIWTKRRNLEQISKFPGNGNLFISRRERCVPQ